MRGSTLLLTAVIYVAHAEVCRLNGCDDARSFHLDRPMPSGFSVAAVVPQPELQCVANVNDFIVCTSGRGGPAWNKLAIPGLTAYSIDDGSMIWNSSEIFNTSGFAFSDLDGNTFASDGFIFIAVSTTGGLLGPPVIIAPVMGDLHSLAATHNQVFVLPSTNSDVATYLSNGVPLGALWLNATIDGVYGTYVSSAPVVVSQDRFYMAAQFQAEKSSSATPPCRLYAVDVHRELVGKMIIAWYANYSCPTESDVLRSEATVLRSNSLLCYIASSPQGHDQVQCTNDQGSSSSIVTSASCAGTIVSLALVQYNSNTLLASCVLPDASVTLLQLDLSAYTHTSTNLTKVLPSHLAQAEVVSRCPMMTFNATAPDSSGLLLAFADTANNSTELVMLAGDEQGQVRFVNSTSLPADVGTCKQQLLAFETRLALVTDSSLVLLA
eukprot:m.24517 g.24517  ORF g.24517 m.24517 type:complete len:438 (-) comp11522_c0_seq1:88-1401(-)